MSARVAGVALAVCVAAAGVSLLGQERPMQLDDTKVPKGRPAPRLANGKPDLSGYWKGTTQTKPGGNIGKDLPGWKLPLTPAGESALKHNVTPTAHPQS